MWLVVDGHRLELLVGLQLVGTGVWVIEGKRIAARFACRTIHVSPCSIYLASVLAYGLGVQALDSSITTLWAITMIVSGMNFWYDALVWSVRRSQI